MDSEYQRRRVEAEALIQTCQRFRAEFDSPPSAITAGINSLVSTARRDVAAAAVGELTDYLIGRRKIGTRAARAAVEAGRAQRKAQLAEVRRRRALSLVDSARLIVHQLNDPIDWKVRSRLETALSRARAGRTWRAVITRVEDVSHELAVYSPPTDPISAVRLIDRRFRELIVTRLSSLGPSWWFERVPPDARRRAEAGAHRRGVNSLAPVDYLTFGEYGKIILDRKNWSEAFAEVLPERRTFERQFLAIKDIRNDVAHSRQVSARDHEKLLEFYSAVLRG